jgi:phosphoribosylformimino-5-aminoimidazole carboxamide ribotide isomerase
MLIRKEEVIDLREGRVVPALDLLGGRVVRLEQGRYDRVTDYPVEPAALARAYADAGAPWLHVVDLEAARSGVRSPAHAALLRELRAVPGVRIQLGGGLRGEAAIRAALAGLADRVIVGTLAAAEPELVGRLAAETGRVVVALDCLDGRIRTHGWLEDAGLEPAGFVGRLADAGARDFLVTGIDRDGTGRGPDLELIGRVRPRAPGVLLAAGGVGSAADVAAALGAGADAVAVGRALLDGAYLSA